MANILLRNGQCPKCTQPLYSDGQQYICYSCPFKVNLETTSCVRNRISLIFFSVRGVHIPKYMGPYSLGDGRYAIKKACLLCGEILPPEVKSYEELLGYGYPRETLL